MHHIFSEAPIPCVKASTTVIQLNRVEKISQGATVSLWSVAYGAMWWLNCTWRGEEICIWKKSLPTTVRLFLYDLSVFFLYVFVFFSALFISWFHGMVFRDIFDRFLSFRIDDLFLHHSFFGRCFGVFFWWTKGIRLYSIWSSSMMKITKKTQDSFEISNLLGDITWTMWTWDMYVFLAEKISPASLFLVETPLVDSSGNQTFPEARLLWIFLCCVTFENGI